MFESSPKEVVDLFSDEEKEGSKEAASSSKAMSPDSVANTAVSMANTNVTVATEDVSSSVIVEQPASSTTIAASVVDQIAAENGDGGDDEVITYFNSRGGVGPMTPPGVDDHETLDLAKGPQTPDMLAADDVDDGLRAGNIDQNGGNVLAANGGSPDSYDPFNPTAESPDDDFDAIVGGSAANESQNLNGVEKSSSSAVTSSMNLSTAIATASSANAADLSVDMDMASPCSPGI